MLPRNCKKYNYFVLLNPSYVKVPEKLKTIVSLLKSSLLRSRFLGCHATLTPKKRLLTTEQHSFPLFDQSQLLFHFREPFRAKFAILNLSNQRLCFISPSHGGTIGDNGDSWRGFPSHVFQIQNCEPKILAETCNAEHCHREGRYLR